MEGIKMTKRPRLKNPVMITAWPGMGEVAFKAAEYLVEKLKATEFAEIPAEEFFYLTGSVVQEGIIGVPELPQSKFYFWKNPAGKRIGPSQHHDLIIFLSSAQPDLVVAQDYCDRILRLAKSFKVKEIATFASMPAPIDHTQEAHVWFTATGQELKSRLIKSGLRILHEGQISGMNGLFLGVAKKEGFEGYCLLGEIPLYTIQIENPKASVKVLNAFTKISGIHIDTSGLLEQAHHIEDDISKLLDYLKVGIPGQAGPIEEEDIERIKKSLSQLTKLPVSVKEKIEKMFVQAEVDISRARELKTELDRWNVYREYEDRFLDLFKKAKEKNN